MEVGKVARKGEKKKRKKTTHKTNNSKPVAYFYLSKFFFHSRNKLQETIVCRKLSVSCACCTVQPRNL